MLLLEPYYNWHQYYNPYDDKKSPYFGLKAANNPKTLYNYYIHPAWDTIGSRTLFVKLLYTNYKQQACIIELMGEWNDAIENDIMFLRRELIDPLMDMGICKFVLVAENVLNFHSGDDDYYTEWFDMASDEDGWIICLNLPESSQHDFRLKKLNYYIELKDKLDWRKYKPDELIKELDREQKNRLN